MGGGNSTNFDKGSSCAIRSSGWSCTYKIFANPSNDAERKINALLNFFGFVGMKTSDQINNNFGGTYAAQYAFLFPPALQNIYVLNQGAKYDGTSRVLSPSEYTIIPNPFYAQAVVLQNIMFGATSFPCSQTYTVPFSISVVEDPGTGYDVIDINYSTITNPGYNQCLTSLYKTLETPQTISGQNECTDGKTVFTTSPSLVYSKDHIDDMFQSNDESLFQCIRVNGYGTNNLNMVDKVLLVSSTKVGPYDTSTNLPCKSLTSPTCTYQICSQSSTAKSINCGIGGCQYVPPGSGNFDSMDECEQCQNNGNCYSNYICCPEQKNYGVCPSKPTPPAPPNSTKYIIIGICIITITFILLVLVIRYRNEVVNGIVQLI